MLFYLGGKYFVNFNSTQPVSYWTCNKSDPLNLPDYLILGSPGFKSQKDTAWWVRAIKIMLSLENYIGTLKDLKPFSLEDQEFTWLQHVDILKGEITFGLAL